MSLFEVGRLCVKIAGRDAGRTCVVVEQVDAQFVVIDGDVRRKRVNVKHLEPLADVIELAEKASADVVAKIFGVKGLPVWRHTAKKVGERPRQVRASKVVSAAATSVKGSGKATPKVKVEKSTSEKPKVVKKAAVKE